MAINKIFQTMHNWREIEEKAKPMATYDHEIKPESLSELELKYFNLAAACHMRDEELTATRARRDAAFIAWRNAFYKQGLYHAGGYQ